jgi:sulfite exporter TauE/SafE
MNGLNLLPVFLVGLAGSVHCAGMCGGIVSALSAVPAGRRVIPIAQAARGTALRMAAYNAGRIASYMLAGAIAGGLAGGAASLGKIAHWQNAAFGLANLMLIALGLYLMNAWRGLARVESAGGALWRRIQPLLRPLLPIDTPLKALGLGGLWGWVPCAMVYSMLLTAALSGSAVLGAAVMLAFGLGTLPMLTALGLLGARVRQGLQRPALRTACGLLVLAFGALGLLRASGAAAPLLQLLGMPDALAAHGWIDALCIGVKP